MHIHVGGQCESGRSANYDSRDATLETGTPKAIGALLIKLMAADVCRQMDADGMKLDPNELCKHLELVEEK